MRFTFVAVLLVAACDPKTTQPPTPAPVVDTSHDASCSGARPSPTHECVQDCGPPVAQAGDPEPGWSWLTADDAAKRKQYGCPICLPEDTMIATPSGDVAITTLEIGDEIWTLDTTGTRVVGHVEYVGSTPISGRHELVRVTLADGRVVRASPGHPDASGVDIGALRSGMTMSGSTIVAIEREPYRGARTHDVLPSGATGMYWADGVIVPSSFAAKRPR